MKLQKALKPEEFAAAMVNVTNRFDFICVCLWYTKTGSFHHSMDCLLFPSISRGKLFKDSLAREQRLETLDKQFQELEEHYKSVLEKVAAA